MASRHPGSMSYSLNSLRGGIWQIISGTTIGLTKGDASSLDYSSYVLPEPYSKP